MKKISLIIAIITTTLASNAQISISRNLKNPKDILNDQYCSPLFKTADGTIFDMTNENVSAYFNILDWLEGRVAGLQVFVMKNGIRLPVIRGSIANIYVDEMLTDPSCMNTLSVNDIGMVKIIKGPFAGAIGNGGGGTIAIYTMKADEDDMEESSR